MRILNLIVIEAITDFFLVAVYIEFCIYVGKLY